MAIMFPAEPLFVEGREAERSVFEALRNQLPDSYRVFYSVAWQLRRHKIGVQDGETDFVILDPYGGFLTLEVKGGKQIAYDSKIGEWRSDDRAIRDPFKQGLKAIYSLRAKIDQLFDTTIPFFFGHAVAFPDVVIDDKDLGLDKPRVIIMDVKDMHQAEEWTNRVFKYYLDKDPNYRFDPFNEEHIQRLETVFCQSQKFSSPQEQYFRDLNQIIDRLTEEQVLLLDFIQRHRKAAISGCAGSGKTLLAVEKAIRLDREGFRVLFLCHNPILAQDIRGRLQGANITVSALKPLIDSIIDSSIQSRIFLPHRKHIFSKAWSQYQVPSDEEIDFTLDELLREPERFDAVIVDEGQDFEHKWFDLVEACLTDLENGILYVFYDDNQLLFSSDLVKRYSEYLAPFTLSRNCRNAGNVYEVFKPMNPTAPQVAPQLAGKGVVKEWIYAKEDEIYPKMGEALAMAEQYSPLLKDIVVISGENTTSQNSKFAGFVFDSPNLLKLNAPARLDWQKGVMKYLYPLGFTEDRLSDASMPTAQDVRMVNAFCNGYRNRFRDLLRREQGVNIQSALVWELDCYGELVLHWRSNRQLETPKVNTLQFFSSPNWPNSLPPAIQRYRLTPLSDTEDNTAYFPVRLADIPSFKGLEANAVLFVLYNPVPGYDFQLLAHLYVALSRAKNLLLMINPMPMSEIFAKARLNL
jgi:hypothetical protein